MDGLPQGLQLFTETFHHGVTSETVNMYPSTSIKSCNDDAAAEIWWKMNWVFSGDAANPFSNFENISSSEYYVILTS